MKKIILGQSLFEVVIALAVISLLLVGLINVTTISVRNSSFSRNNTLANRYAQEAVEWFRGERDFNWVTFLAHATASNAHANTYCLDSLGWSDTGACVNEPIPTTPFTRQALFACYTNNGTVFVPACNVGNIDTVEITVTVSWSDGQGAHNVTLPVQLTDWRTQ